jgi:hypothetical protein
MVSFRLFAFLQLLQGLFQKVGRLPYLVRVAGFAERLQGSVGLAKGILGLPRLERQESRCRHRAAAAAADEDSHSDRPDYALARVRSLAEVYFLAALALVEFQQTPQALESGVNGKGKGRQLRNQAKLDTNGQVNAVDAVR